MAGVKLEDMSARDLTSVLYSMMVDDVTTGRTEARQLIEERMAPPPPDPFANADPATWGMDPEAIAAAERAKVT